MTNTEIIERFRKFWLEEYASSMRSPDQAINFILTLLQERDNELRSKIERLVRYNTAQVSREAYEQCKQDVLALLPQPQEDLEETQH